jgi:DNA-binding beta-propeller fold protein YncE
MRVPPDLARTATLTLAIGAVLVAHLAAGEGAPGATTPPAGTTAPARLVWPPPPAPARIRFVRALDPTSARGKPSLLSKVWHLLVGASEAAVMQQPYGVAVGPDRKLYVADTFGGVVHVYDLAKAGHSRIKVNGQSLIGVAVTAGRLFVTDSVAGTVIGLDLKGHVLWTLGRKAGLSRPTGIVAAADRLYVVDTMHHAVVMVSLAGAYLGAFGAQGDGPGQFNFPTNIARSPDGKLYVTDTMNFRVQVFDAEGEFLSMFGRLGDGVGDFEKPKGVAVDSAGHIYVVEGLNDAVQIFDQSGRLLLSFGSSGSSDGQFWLPSGIAIVNDIVYVADSANRRVQVFEYLKARE